MQPRVPVKVNEPTRAEIIPPVVCCLLTMLIGLPLLFIPLAVAGAFNDSPQPPSQPPSQPPPLHPPLSPPLLEHSPPPSSWASDLDVMWYVFSGSPIKCYLFKDEAKRTVIWYSGAGALEDVSTGVLDHTNNYKTANVNFCEVLGSVSAQEQAEELVSFNVLTDTTFLTGDYYFGLTRRSPSFLGEVNRTHFDSTGNVTVNGSSAVRSATLLLMNALMDSGKSIENDFALGGMSSGVSFSLNSVILSFDIMKQVSMVLLTAGALSSLDGSSGTPYLQGKSVFTYYDRHDPFFGTLSANFLNECCGAGIGFPTALFAPAQPVGYVNCIQSVVGGIPYCTEAADTPFTALARTNQGIAFWKGGCVLSNVTVDTLDGIPYERITNTCSDNTEFTTHRWTADPLSPPCPKGAISGFAVPAIHLVVTPACTAYTRVSDVMSGNTRFVFNKFLVSDVKD